MPTILLQGEAFERNPAALSQRSPQDTDRELEHSFRKIVRGVIGFSLAPRPIVHSDLAWGRRSRENRRTHGAQETHAARPTAGKSLSLCQSLCWPATESKPQAFQSLMKRSGMALMSWSNLGDLLAEGTARTGAIATEEPPPTETEHDTPASAGKIGEHAEKAAVDAPGPVMTDRTAGTRGGRRHFEAQLRRPDLAGVHLDPGEVREYLREQVQMMAHGLTPEEAGSDDTMFSGAISSPNDLHLLTTSVPEPRITGEVSCCICSRETCAGLKSPYRRNDLCISAEIDHKTPYDRQRPETSNDDNLVWACTSCNKRKGMMTAEEFGNWHGIPVYERLAAVDTRRLGRLILGRTELL